MPELLRLEIVTPERQLVHREVSDVQLPGKDGALGIQPATPFFWVNSEPARYATRFPARRIIWR